MIKPLHQYLLLERVIPEAHRETRLRLPMGRVVQVADGIKDLPIGSLVFYSRNCGEFINYQSQIYLLIRYQDLLAILALPNAEKVD